MAQHPNHEHDKQKAVKKISAGKNDAERLRIFLEDEVENFTIIRDRFATVLPTIVPEFDMYIADRLEDIPDIIKTVLNPHKP